MLVVKTGVAALAVKRAGFAVSAAFARSLSSANKPTESQNEVSAGSSKAKHGVKLYPGYQMSNEELIAQQQNQKIYGKYNFYFFYLILLQCCQIHTFSREFTKFHTFSRNLFFYL
jgi:hypothetical protein